MTTTRRRLLLFSAIVPFLSRFSSDRTRKCSQIPRLYSISTWTGWNNSSFQRPAMPEDKFFWAPTNGEFKGVRNFAEQLIHVAEVNFALSAAILGENPPKDTSAEAMKTRSAVLHT
jgi:hypothetical protein